MFCTNKGTFITVYKPDCLHFKDALLYFQTVFVEI